MDPGNGFIEFLRRQGHGNLVDLQLADLFRDLVETVRAGVGEVPVYLGKSNSI